MPQNCRFPWVIQASWPPESIPPNGSSINSTIFVELTVVTDRHRPRNICNHRLHPMLCTVMQPNNHTYTHVNGPFSRTTLVSQYLRDKTSLNFTDAGNSEWQWHQLGHYASLHLALDRYTCQHPTTQFLQVGRPSCHPTDSSLITSQ